VNREDYLGQPFGTASELLTILAKEISDRVAIVDHNKRLTYRELDDLVGRISAQFQRVGIPLGSPIALCGANSIEYAGAYLGALRAGLVVVPLPASLSSETLRGMLVDSGARIVVADHNSLIHFEDLITSGAIRCIGLDAMTLVSGSSDRFQSAQEVVKPSTIGPDAPANVIYSSGTTGVPKGVVQPHSMRWTHLGLGRMLGDAPVMMISTPLYSTGGSVGLFMALGAGGSAIIMERFDPRKFLELAQDYRATHAALVPVQYQRILADQEFSSFDLSSFRATFSMAAPSSEDLKREILRRWPGGLIEFYSMTEGGAATALFAHERPDKLHTVGQRTTPDIDIRIIDDDSRELPPGHVGEIVGRSATMMNEYYKKPSLTEEAVWYDENGRRFIRTGDLGWFDVEGFLTIVDRKKDVVISGGQNVYSSDLESVLLKHQCVAEVAIVGVPSERWGETPFGIVVLKHPDEVDKGALLDWANGQLNKVQRMSGILVLDQLPRNPMGKIIKRELRDAVQELLADQNQSLAAVRDLG
jgi:acyl-CoA synthetase (AMP-forming)/AMP-acid ligase II